MKTVIVITRGGEYNSDCEVYKKTIDCKYESGKDKLIHKYIKEQFKKAIVSNNDANKEQYKSLISEMPEMPSLNAHETRSEHKQKRAEGDEREYFDWLYNEKIIPILDRTLHVDDNSIVKAQICDKAIRDSENLPDNKPYLSFPIDDSNVYFVFLDRIFGSIFADKRKYDFLIGDDNRLDFITNICLDCGVTEDKDNQNMLYIHDEEWYVAGSSYAPLVDGEFTKETSNKEQQQELKKYFKTIKVFTHTQNPIFEEIRNLNFSEYYRDAEILKNGYC